MKLKGISLSFEQVALWNKVRNGPNDARHDKEVTTLDTEITQTTIDLVAAKITLHTVNHDFWKFIENFLILEDGVFTFWKIERKIGPQNQGTKNSTNIKSEAFLA